MYISYCQWVPAIFFQFHELIQILQYEEEVE